MIPATRADREAIIAFLRAHLETSMFPLSNLILRGMDGGHPTAMRFWIDGDPVRGLIGVTDAGMLLPQAPLDDFTGISALLHGTPVIGILGEAGQVAKLRGALRLTQSPKGKSQDEPLFSLSLAELILPSGLSGFELRPLSAAPGELILSWRTDYQQEALGSSPANAVAEAASNIDAYLAADSHRVLFQNGAPVAMTGFNARLPDAVQIGGVWTPPALRGRGFARSALALHLLEARADGVTKAILFAANAMAARAYVALGFTQIGWFNITLFDRPQMVRHE